MSKRTATALAATPEVHHVTTALSAGAIDVAAGDVVALSVDPSGPSWMKVLPAGTFAARGHGQFTSGNQAALQAIIDRTKQHLGATELFVDFDHQVVTTKKTGGNARAAGWVKALEARQDGIWAQIEWTEEARGLIQGKQYRYLSPLFAHTKEGQVLRLLNVALVNMPALDLDAVAASLNLNTEPEPMDKILKALGLKEGTSEDAVLAALGALTQSRTDLIDALGLKEDATGETVVAAAKALNEGRTKIAEAIGLKADATGEQIVAAAAGLREGAGENYDPAKFVPIADVKALRDELATFKSERTAEKAEQKVDKAIQDGKLIPAQREWGIKLCSRDPEAFDEFVGKAVSLTESQMRGNRAPTTEKVTALSDAQRDVADQLGISHDDFLKQLQAEQENGK